MGPSVLEAYVSSFIAASPGPVVHFGWHGGEPTLAGIGFYSRVLELQRRHVPPGWHCINNLQTNGTLLDEQWCRFLAENDFAVGISIDGPARLHDACRPDRRGRPTHARVMRGLRLLREAGIDPDVLCTLNSVTAAHPWRCTGSSSTTNVRWVQFLPVVERGPGGAVSELSVDPGGDGWFPLHGLRRVGPLRHRANWCAELPRVLPRRKRQAAEPLRDVRDLRAGPRPGARRERLCL